MGPADLFVPLRNKSSSYSARWPFTDSAVPSSLLLLLRSAGLQPADLLLILLFLPHYYCYYYSSHINFQKRLKGLKSWNLHKMYKMWIIVKMIFRISLIALPVPEICAEMTSKTALNANISKTAHHIDAQFVAVSTELNSAHFVWRHLFRKYFRYARMTSLKYSKFNFSAAISNIYAQFAPVNRGLYSASIMPNNFFKSTSGIRERRHWNFQSFISPLL